MSRETPDRTAPNPQQIVFGADVIMTRQGREITLHAPGAGGRRVLGRYASAAEAWRALDDIDAPLEISEAA
jgi:hypothetical protein